MFNQLEREIKQLEGIISCRVTGERKIDEIHIIAGKDRDPKKIVRDIETLVLVDFDSEIDHKKISIAQINQEEAIINGKRIELVSIYRENNRPCCHFRLKINDNLIEEEIEGLVEDSLSQIVAEGLVLIIQEYTSFPGKIRVENIFTTGLNDEIIVVQLIVYKNESLSDQERLLGAAYIKHDLPLATGKACLKALNRHLTYFK